MIPPKPGFLHDIDPHQTTHPPTCAREGQVLEKPGSYSPVALRNFTRSEPVVIVVLASRVRLVFMPLLEGLDPLPGYWHRYVCPIELCEMVSAVVICARYCVGPEPPPRELLHRLVLVVEVVVVHQHPVTFLDLLWP